MNRRHFAGLLFTAPASLYFSEAKSNADTSTQVRCGVCGFPAAFDNWLDINLCPQCDAHETMDGWETR